MGAGRIPIGPEQAKAWLAAHPDETVAAAPAAVGAAERRPPRRRAPDAGALSDHTPYERYDQAADGWFLDFVEGQDGRFDAADAAAAAIDTTTSGSWRRRIEL